MSGATRTDGRGRLAPSLDSLTLLLTDRNRLRRWLHTCDEEVRQPFTKAVLLIGALGTATGLPVVALLDELRCQRRGPQGLESLTESRIEQCIDFLAWVLALVLAAPGDRALARGVVRSASAMFVDAGRDLDVCRRALEEPIAGDERVTPRELIEIGEVGIAFEAARAALPGPVGARAARWHRHSSGGRKTHVGWATLDALLRYSNDQEPGETLGVTRAAALLRHIDGCPNCWIAYGARARARGERPVEPSLVEVP